MDVIDWAVAGIARWAVPDQAIRGIGNPASAALERILLTLTWETMPQLGQAFLGLAEATNRAIDELFALAEVPKP